MKIIDILNKRANGEKIPNFKYDNMTFIFDEKHGYIDDNEGDSLLQSICTDFSNINAEVEIIEEEKKIPEKLPTWFSVENQYQDSIDYMNYNFETLYEKINEIIDYLESKGED